MHRVWATRVLRRSGLLCAALMLLQLPAEAARRPASHSVVDRHGHSHMLAVPAGPFVMGDDVGNPLEQPRRTVEAAAFAIDRTEVSNGQYREFLAWVHENGDGAVAHPQQPAGKDHTPRYWKPFVPKLLHKTGIAELRPFDEATFTRDDFPVVGVDWYDAYAYARWAGKRLPTHAEWEKAARGTDGRVWPWGNEWHDGLSRCGGYERSPVGASTQPRQAAYAGPVAGLPRGASPFGCLNMAGNVGEWVADATASPVPGSVDKLWRVVKGGGSSSYPSAVRAAAATAHEPEFRDFTIGFRCAADSMAAGVSKP